MPTFGRERIVGFECGKRRRSVTYFFVPLSGLGRLEARHHRGGRQFRSGHLVPGKARRQRDKISAAESLLLPLARDTSAVVGGILTFEGGRAAQGARCHGQLYKVRTFRKAVVNLVAYNFPCSLCRYLSKEAEVYHYPASGRYDVGGLQSYLSCKADFEKNN